MSQEKNAQVDVVRKFEPGDKVFIKKGALHGNLKKLENNPGTVKKYAQWDSEYEARVLVDWGEICPWSMNEDDLQLVYGFTFDQYQDNTGETATYPHNIPDNLAAVSYCTLGLTGEAGEVAEKVKKLLRDGDSPEKRQAVLKEVGDVLWYISQLLKELGGFSMADVAQGNLKKLEERRQRGTIHGDGDNR